MQLDTIPSVNSADLIETILCADRAFNSADGDLRAFALSAAIVMDEIWLSRSKVVHQDEAVTTRELTLAIRRRYMEHAAAWADAGRRQNLFWRPPQSGWLKLNSDVAIRPNRSYITISVRDSFSSL